MYPACRDGNTQRVAFLLGCGFNAGADGEGPAPVQHGREPRGGAEIGGVDRAVHRAVAQQLKGLNMKAHKGTKRKARKALLDALDAAIEADKAVSLMD